MSHQIRESYLMDINLKIQQTNATTSKNAKYGMISLSVFEDINLYFSEFNENLKPANHLAILFHPQFENNIKASVNVERLVYKKVLERSCNRTDPLDRKSNLKNTQNVLIYN